MEEPLGDSWMLSPSGSGAQDPWPDESYYQEPNDTFTIDVNTSEHWEGADTVADDSTFANTYGADLAPGQLMSTKVPPAYNGKGNWFQFEELVYDWMDITVLAKDKMGPALKGRLCEDALVYKTTLDRARLKDENNGVDYFLKTLRPLS